MEAQLRTALARGDRLITAHTRLDGVRDLPRDVAGYVLEVLVQRRPLPIVRDSYCTVCLKYADLLFLAPHAGDPLVRARLAGYEMRRFATHTAYLVPRVV